MTDIDHGYALFDDLDDEYPVDFDHAAGDVGSAVKAVMIHDGEDWPAGRFCRNCHARFPCRLRRWGERVLSAAGWSHEEIVDAPRRAAR